MAQSNIHIDKANATYADDVVIDTELVRLGIVETLEQNIDGFNASSNGTIVLTSQALEGDYSEEAFIKGLTAGQLVTRRDYLSDKAVTPVKLVEDAVNTIKLSRRYGPFATTYDAWNRSNRDVSTFSLAIGKQLGVGIGADMLNSSITAAVAAIEATQAVVGTGAAAFDYKDIVNGLATMGDKAGRIQMLVMHSDTYFSIVDKGLSMNALENVGGMTIREGGAYSLGLPVLVTDSDALKDGAGKFKVLGLTEGAVKAIESDTTIMRAQDVLLNENLQRVIQGEASYNVGVKGCKFDVSKVNPIDADLGDKANWSYLFSDVKSGGGFVMSVKKRA